MAWSWSCGIGGQISASPPGAIIPLKWTLICSAAEVCWKLNSLRGRGLPCLDAMLFSCTRGFLCSNAGASRGAAWVESTWLSPNSMLCLGTTDSLESLGTIPGRLLSCDLSPKFKFRCNEPELFSKTWFPARRGHPQVNRGSRLRSNPPLLGVDGKLLSERVFDGRSIGPPLPEEDRRLMSEKVPDERRKGGTDDEVIGDEDPIRFGCEVAPSMRGWRLVWLRRRNLGSGRGVFILSICSTSGILATLLILNYMHFLEAGHLSREVSWQTS